MDKGSDNFHLEPEQNRQEDSVLWIALKQFVLSLSST